MRDRRRPDILRRPRSRGNTSRMVSAMHNTSLLRMCCAFDTCSLRKWQAHINAGQPSPGISRNAASRDFHVASTGVHWNVMICFDGHRCGANRFLGGRMTNDPGEWAVLDHGCLMRFMAPDPSRIPSPAGCAHGGGVDQKEGVVERRGSNGRATVKGWNNG